MLLGRMRMTVDVRGVDRMQRELEHMSKRSVPFAARDTVNGLAFETRRVWGLEMQRALTLRNRYTQSRAIVEKATTLRIDAMQARLGHVEDYVRRLEEGEGERASGSARAIPTEHAAGQAKGTLGAGRKRLVRKPNYVAALGKMPRPRAGYGRKARNAAAVRAAQASPTKVALLDLGKRKGLYRVTGKGKRARIRKLYDLSKRSTPRPKLNLLSKALTKAYALAPHIAHKALTRQLERLGP